MTTPTPRHVRILVGAACYADAKIALQLLDYIAEKSISDIGGVLVEETVFSEAPSLPSQRIITTSGSMIMMPTATQLQTLYKSDAAAFERTLARLAQARQVRASFERRRGELVQMLCDAAKGWDVLLLGRRIMSGPAGRVILIATSDQKGDGARSMAERLARHQRTDVLTVVLAQPSDKVSVQDENQIVVFSERELLDYISRINTSGVVLDLAAGPLHTPDQLRALLEAARCPLLAFGASQSVPEIEHSTIIPPTTPT